MYLGIMKPASVAAVVLILATHCHAYTSLRCFEGYKSLTECIQGLAANNEATTRDAPNEPPTRSELFHYLMTCSKNLDLKTSSKDCLMDSIYLITDVKCLQQPFEDHKKCYDSVFRLEDRKMAICTLKSLRTLPLQRYITEEQCSQILEAFGNCLTGSTTTEELLGCSGENIWKGNLVTDPDPPNPGSTFGQGNLFSTLTLFQILLLTQPRGSLLYPGRGWLSYRLSPVLAAYEALIILYFLFIPSKRSTEPPVASYSLKAIGILYLRTLPLPSHTDAAKNIIASQGFCPKRYYFDWDTLEIHKKANEIWREECRMSGPGLRKDLLSFSGRLGFWSRQIQVFTILGLIVALIKTLVPHGIPMVVLFSTLWAFSWIVVQLLVILATSSDPISEDELTGQQLFLYVAHIAHQTEIRQKLGMDIFMHHIWNSQIIIYLYMSLVPSSINPLEDQDIKRAFIEHNDTIGTYLTMYMLHAVSYLTYALMWANDFGLDSPVKVFERLTSLLTVGLLVFFICQLEMPSSGYAPSNSTTRETLTTIFLFVVIPLIAAFMLRGPWALVHTIFMLYTFTWYITCWNDEGSSKPDWLDWLP
ncbi:hypothetical protein TWF730_004008 [Orbilia blumenaviensis]|uniref:Uncharacterized protein n=1 Tax=Orbilia blumenaviensis TaxID=1796055 RepID=A0AAV9U1C7_9PEZI